LKSQQHSKTTKEEEERTDKSLALVEPNLDDDFFLPKSTNLIHFAVLEVISFH
jgi:hypothetical protein